MITVDAIKYSYRQNKEGMVVSFVIHPNDAHGDLANAPIGSQWQLSLVPLDKDGNAETNENPCAGAKPTSEGQQHAPSRPCVEPADGRTAGSIPATGAKRQPFASLPLPQQAALLCNDPVFWAFVREEWGKACECVGDATEAMYWRYDITTRSALLNTNPAGENFRLDRDHFISWKLVAA